MSGLIPTPEETRAANIGYIAPTQSTSLAQDQATAANQGQPGYDIFGNSTTPPTTSTTPPAAVTQSTTQPDGSKSTTKVESAAPQQQQLTMPANGSVVDLLNMAGQDSSYQARAGLAETFGIKNYTGTGPQNTELAQKYLSIYGAKKDTPAPQSGTEAMSGVSDTRQPSADETQAQFMQQYYTMNPVLKTFFDTLNQVMSTTSTRTSLVDEYSRLYKEELGPLQTELMDINKVIDGTEDDIRNEVTKSGGFATESQVQALSLARNKVLIKRAQSIQDTLDNKKDYVNQIMTLTGLDREQVDKDLDRKLGISKTMYDTFNSMQNAAATNYRAIADKVGYDGLAAALGNNPQMQHYAEQSLGLPSGALSDPDFLALQSQKPWGKPYMLGGDYVQENTKTGEIRTAVNVAAGKTGSGSSSGPLSSPDGNEWSDLMYSITQRSGIAEGLRNDLSSTLSNAIKTGNYNTMYQMVADATGDKMTAENKTKFDNARNDLLMMQDLNSALAAYQNAGGDMNLAKAAALNAGARVGILAADKPYASLARQLDAVFQQYRQNMTGAAFGAAESRDYQKVRPSSSGSFDLNDAVISGAISYANNFVTNNIQNQIGTQGVLVKQMMEQKRGTSSGPVDGLSNDTAYDLYLKIINGN